MADELININSCTGGIDQDTSFSDRKPDKYWSLQNAHVVSHGGDGTGDGNSTGIIENEKGDRVLFTVPATYPLYELGFILNTQYIYQISGAMVYNLSITVRSGATVDTHTYSYSGTETTTDLYNALIASHASGGFADWITAGTLKILQRGNRIIFASYGVTINTGDIQQSIDVTSSPALSNLTAKITALSNLYVLGITSLRDDLVVFTTSETSSYYGQIWRLSFDTTNTNISGLSSSNLVVKTHLKYNGALNLKLDYRILDYVPRYENDDFAKVWFTDNYNNLRSINLNDDDCWALDADELETIPYHKQQKPRITDIYGGGNFKSGVVEYASQCYNNYGQLSKVTPESRITHLVSSLEHGLLTDSCGYIGNSSSKDSLKTVEILVNADVNYDVCRLFAITYTTLNGTPEIRIVDEYIIPPNGEITFIDDGEKSLGTLTTVEFNELTGILFKCKNIIEKDNIPIASNITEDYFDIDFDARCVRYKVDGTATGSTYVSNFDTSTESDDINPFNNFDKNIYALLVADNRYIYQKSKTGFGADRVMGGTGRDQFSLGVPNVSYQFKLFFLDGDVGKAADGGNDKCSYIDERPHHVFGSSKEEFPTDIPSNTELIDTPLEVNNSFWNYKSPYVDGLFKGYQRDEIYRFGIVFYDKRGRQSFVKWIGDIRMPMMADYDDNSDSFDIIHGAHEGFKLAYYDGAATINNAKIYALYPEFTVNLPDSIISQISGYSIVRCKREGKDRTILSQGLLTRKSRTDAAFVPEPVEYAFGVPAGHFYNVPNNPNNEFQYISPENNFNGAVALQDGDLFKCEGVFDATQVVYGDVITVPPDKVIAKYYQNKMINYSSMYAAGTAILLEEPIESIDPFYNYSLLGQLTHIGSAPFTPVSTNFHDDYFIVNYRRNQSNRYGGDNLMNRNRSEYIYCGHYTPNESMTDGAGYYSSTVGVMGGDTYVCFYDFLRENHGTEYFTTGTGGLASDRIGIIFPIETSINLEIRHDLSVSRYSYAAGAFSLTPIRTLLPLTILTYTISGQSITFETGALYQYNSAYSQEHNLIKFFPKPINFNSIETRDTEIRNGQIRLVGQTIDYWNTWLVNDFVNVNPEYGAIHDTKKFNNTLYFLQDNALGAIQINERVTMPDSTGTEMVLGVGETLGKYSYITTNSGTKHKHSVQVANGIYYFDVKNKKIMVYHGDNTPLSDIKGLHNYLYNFAQFGSLYNTDSPLSYAVGTGVLTPIGVESCYDKKNNRLLYTFYNSNKTPFTIGYNMLMGAFESFYSYKSGIYHSHGDKVLSMYFSNPNTITDLKKVNVHEEGNYGEFSGTQYTTYYECVANRYPETTKIFNNLEFNSYAFNVSTGLETFDDTIDYISFINSYQDTGTITLTSKSNIRRRIRTWRMDIPRNSGTKERMRDKYLRIRMSYSNSDNRRFWLYDIITKFLTAQF